MVKKIKSKKFQINLSNRLYYSLIAVGVLVLLGVGVYAFGTNSPQIFGHSIGEIDFNYEVVEYTTIVGNNLVYTINASCPPGKQLLGGGCAMFDSNDLSAENHDLINSYPQSNEWYCSWDVDISHIGWQRAYAICANVQ